MKKFLTASTMVVVLAGCGGGGGGVETSDPLVVEPASSRIVSDVLIKELENRVVRLKDQDNQCTIEERRPVCTKATYGDDEVVFTFSLRPTTEQEIGPVKIMGYKLTYDNCVNGEVYIDLPSAIVVEPNQQREMNIVVVPYEVKEDMVQEEQYTYTSPDGCQTTFTRPAYTTSCIANATIEFDVFEVVTERSRKVRKQIQVEFQDIQGQEECR